MAILLQHHQPATVGMNAETRAALNDVDYDNCGFQCQFSVSVLSCSSQLATCCLQSKECRLTSACERKADLLVFVGSPLVRQLFDNQPRPSSPSPRATTMRKSHARPSVAGSSCKLTPDARSMLARGSPVVVGVVLRWQPIGRRSGCLESASICKAEAQHAKRSTESQVSLREAQLLLVLAICLLRARQIGEKLGWQRRNKHLAAN